MTWGDLGDEGDSGGGGAEGGGLHFLVECFGSVEKSLDAGRARGRSIGRGADGWVLGAALPFWFVAGVGLGWEEKLVFGFWEGALDGRGS